MANFRINEMFMTELEKKLAKIQKKCEKHGCAFTFKETGEEFETIKDDVTEQEITTRFVLVEVEGTAIVNGWEFAASIDKTENGNIIDKAPSCDVEVPRKYWTSSLYCEHCQQKRQRRHVFLVRNTETGEFKQVGRACLAEYTHGLSAEMVASIMECKRACEEAEAAWNGCSFGSMQKYEKSEDVLALAFGAVRAFGYAPTSEIYCTKERVCDYIRCIRGELNRDAFGRYWKNPESERIQNEMDAHQISMTNEKDLEDSRKALEWLKEQEESTDYMHNLKTAIGEYTNASRMGLLISLVPTYCKAIEREIERQKREEEKAKEAQESKHVGEVGKRYSFIIDSFRILTSWHNDFGGYYGGEIYIYKFTDADGNVYIWKTGNALDDNCIGKTMTGTIKEHGEFNGVKQNNLTRCKVA